MKRRSVRRSRRAPSKRRWWRFLPILILLLLLGIGVFHYRNAIAYYFSFRNDKQAKTPEQKRLQRIREFQVLERHAPRAAGIDVSEYQGRIIWDSVRNVAGQFPIEYVFIRATAGSDRPDAAFKRNWKGAAKAGLLKGAYHYYRPDENSIKQADLFIRTVTLRKGDLPPVLDIEKVPASQSVDSLKKGLKRWLDKVEAHYHMKPIIYTGEKYYDAFLADDFPDYPFWIANYNFFVEEIDDDWLMWQFSESARVSGIKGTVDLNIFNGTKKELRLLGK
ncbi:MAG TPA: glycoside hydrolase family 25 protein [Flavobacterium sp.]|nr:glycoside hydrolase family 25 protein [Flavobacterium sp.]